jgi:DNA-directed RNA polymerase subunit RPC12/RpoP
MTSCRHLHLVLLPPQKSRLRCRTCHLTITPDELNELTGGYCPECFEAHGKKQYDFEEIPAADQEKTRYQCEECGVIIEA